MFKTKSFILIGLLTFFAIEANAQSQYGTWNSVELDKALNKKWTLKAEGELRTIYYVRLINRWDVGLNAEYQIAKPVELNVGYQLMNVLDQKYLNYQFRHRFSGDITGKLDCGDFSFDLSEGAQVTTKDDSKRIKASGKIDTYKINPAWMWKNALEVQYDIPHCKITPEFEFRTYYTLNDPDGNSFDKLRYTFSIKYKLNKHNDMKLFGVYNQELGTDEADYSGKYILGVKYTHELKKHSKK